MRRLLPAAAAVIALAATSGPAAGDPPAIGQAGRHFVDETGRTRILHGIAFTYKEHGSEEFSAEFDEDDAAFLAQNGLTLLRLAVFASGVMPAPGVFDPAYVDGIGDIVDVAAEAGLDVIVDFHQDVYANKYNGRGMPDWMGEDDGVPVSPDTGNLAANYFANPSVWRAFDNFWMNAPADDGVPLQEHFARAWRYVAEKFANHPGVMGFEIMNEPFPGSQWTTCASPAGCPAFDQLMLTEFSKRIGKAIAEAAPDKFVIYEPNVTFDFGADTYHGDIVVRPAAFSYHVYCLGLQFGTPPTGDLACEDLGERPQFRSAAKHADTYQVPLILSEFGHFTAGKDEDVSGVIDRVANLAAEIGSSWTYWDYAIGNPQGAKPYGSAEILKDLRRPPTEDNLMTERVDAIVRAYPRAVAGTPTHYAWDSATKTFTLEYTPARADGSGSFGAGSITEVFVPARRFPDGYSVEVTGASVVSAPGAQILKLALDEAADGVTLTITPSGN
ncbi:MAG: cellulase family glycosylhydrolase [Actinomycetota bacterium]